MAIVFFPVRLAETKKENNTVLVSCVGKWIFS